MKFFDFFKNLAQDGGDSAATGGAANLINNADFSNDSDFFQDVESWGERIAAK